MNKLFAARLTNYNKKESNSLDSIKNDVIAIAEVKDSGTASKSIYMDTEYNGMNKEEVAKKLLEDKHPYGVTYRDFMDQLGRAFDEVAKKKTTTSSDKWNGGTANQKKDKCTMVVKAGKGKVCNPLTYQQVGLCVQDLLQWKNEFRGVMSEITSSVQQDEYLDLVYFNKHRRRKVINSDKK
jgi:hypothetical protein